MKNHLSRLLRLLRSRHPFCAMAALGLLTVGSLDSASAQSLTFATYGDMPYNIPNKGLDNYIKTNGTGVVGKEADGMVLQYLILPTLKNRDDIKFVIHLGDIGRPESACIDESTLQSRLPERKQPWLQPTLQSTLASWQGLGKPVFYTPGDNDWTDCNRAGGNPLVRLGKIREVIFDGSAAWQTVNAPAVGVWTNTRELVVPPAGTIDTWTLSLPGPPKNTFANYPENWMWGYFNVEQEMVVFATVHDVGSNNGWVDHKPNESEERKREVEARQKEVNARNTNNKTWIEVLETWAKDSKAKAVVIATHVDPFEYAIGGNCKPAYLLLCRALTTLADDLKEIQILMIHGDTNGHCLDRPFTQRNLWRLNAPGDVKVIDADVVTFNPKWNSNYPSSPPFTVTGLLSNLPPPNTCDNNENTPDPTLSANRLGALVHTTGANCQDTNIVADGDLGNIVGFVSVTRKSKDGYSAMVTINNGAPKTTYKIGIKCISDDATDPTLTTDVRGFGQITFTSPTTENVFAVGIHKVDDTGNQLYTYQSEKLDFTGVQ